MTLVMDTKLKIKIVHNIQYKIKKITYKYDNTKALLCKVYLMWRFLHNVTYYF